MPEKMKKAYNTYTNHTVGIQIYKQTIQIIILNYIIKKWPDWLLQVTAEGIINSQLVVITDVEEVQKT